MCSQRGRGRGEGSPSAGTSEGSVGGAGAPPAPTPTVGANLQEPRALLARGRLPHRTWCPAVYAVPWLPDTSRGNSRRARDQLQAKICFFFLLYWIKTLRHKPPQNGNPVPSSPGPTGAQAALLEAAGNTTDIHTPAPCSPGFMGMTSRGHDVRPEYRPAPPLPPPGSTSMPKQRGKPQAPDASRSSGEGAEGLRAAAPFPPTLTSPGKT